MEILDRPRRNRKNKTVRDLVAETELQASHLIYPMFLLPGDKLEQPLLAMEGQSRLSLDKMMREMESCMELGLKSFVLFPCIPDSEKDKTASLSWKDDNFYLNAIRKIKASFTEAIIMTDVAMDPYSSDGHDGFVENDQIVNDKTLEILSKMAVAQAQAGADILGPSDMMDGRVGVIRRALEQNGFYDVSIMSYTAKYVSSFYGPFREALDSAPKKGDKKTYQMDYRNAHEAVREAALDVAEGADILMVKPALCYLDVIQKLKQNFTLPIAAYNVSGEYAMIKAAAKNGWMNEEAAMIESLTAIRRAGADIILTYWAKAFAQI